MHVPPASRARLRPGERRARCGPVPPPWIHSPAAATARALRVIVEEFFFDGVPAEPGDGAQSAGDRGPAPATGFQLPAKNSMSARRAPKGAADAAGTSWGLGLRPRCWANSQSPADNKKPNGKTPIAITPGHHCVLHGAGPISQPTLHDRRLGAQELSGASSRVQRPYQPFRCAAHDPAREACDWPGPAPQQLQMHKQNGGSRGQ